ncbi:MAG: hypothetical protein ACM3NH_01590 [Candidatus Saccharibacteria bacterium]
MNLVIWFFAGAMTGVTFSRLAALAGGVFRNYAPPAAYFSIGIGALAAVGTGLVISREFTKYYIFTFDPGDFDFAAVIAAEAAAIIALAVLYILG